MHLATTLAGVELEHPLMNAAGTCKTVEDVERFARSAVSAITVGSITMEPRSSGEGQTYWWCDSFSLNSLNMPNRGQSYYRQHLPKMMQIAHASGKALFVNVAGFQVTDYSDLAEIAMDGGADGIELNLGCPNVWHDGLQKPIASFEPVYMSNIIAAVSAVTGRIPLGVKLSPYSDPLMLAKVVQESIPVSTPISYVVACNTLPNAFLLDGNGNPVVSIGLAGLSGTAMKPISLGQVKQLRALLPERIQLVGIGGIRRGHDVLDYLRAGATAVQAATAYWNTGENPGVYSDILQDMVDLEWI